MGVIPVKDLDSFPMDFSINNELVVQEESLYPSQREAKNLAVAGRLTEKMESSKITKIPLKKIETRTVA